jgi:DNA-binding NarL/FixJ family response regulator
VTIVADSEASNQGLSYGSGVPVTLRPRILLADDHDLIRETARKLLRTEFEVVGAVNNGRAAVDAALALAPDVVVLDILMPEMDGFHAAREMRRRGSQAKVVFLTLQWDQGYVAAAQESGGFAYVLKSRMNADLIPAVSQALAGSGFKTFLTA